MKDPKGRKIDYLRISITDRCNERCVYCMPEDFQQWLPREEILTYEEILSVVEVAAGLGVRKIRVTGGEPLLRKGAVDFIGKLFKVKGIETVTLTTNATRLASLAKPLYDVGLERVNISLDAIDSAIYKSLTGGVLENALAGIRAARDAGMKCIKLNMVLMRGKNENQIWPLLNYAKEMNLPLRFIELMPVSLTDMLDENNFYPIEELKKYLRRYDDLDMLDHQDAFGFGPARYYQMRKTGVTVGFIGAISDLHFCETCNKVRLTCDGKLRPCLGNHLETDLKAALRPSIDSSRIEQLIQSTLWMKPDEHVFRDNYQPGRIMTAIGG
ncbi:MAG: GTP 3',8-cyclase MoaA [Verrucomicrobiota bacterium]